MTELLALGTADLARCQDLMRAGSKSFTAASWLLPSRTRAAASAVYAFCRVADDVVDEGGGEAGLDQLRRRLDDIYAGTPADDPVDRAFAHVVRVHQIPRSVPEWLLDGFAWDVSGRTYETLSDTVAYGVRVASTVGLMMTAVMGRQAPETLARAADLGVAMQLTNIARDVGEDARNGRIYLPREWLDEAGVSPAALGRDPQFEPALGGVVGRLLDEADALYARADAGITHLPADCRMSIRSAGLIYRDIGRVVRRNQLDSVSRRATTGLPRKLWLLGRSLGARWWRRQPGTWPALPEAKPLVDDFYA